MNESLNPILVEVYRAGVLESFHRGAVCVVDRNRKIIYREGNVEQVCYPRSAMKFFQVLPLIMQGGRERFGFTLEEIAVMCGSHNAEPAHLAAVDSILRKIGLDRGALKCGAQYPTSKKDSNALIRAGEKPGHVHNNCSGKHAGMLALCVLLNEPVDHYLDPGHRVQVLIREVCSTMYEYPEAQMTAALDGCSAPVYAVPVLQQAIGFRNLADPSHFDHPVQHACRVVIEAVSEHPFMVAGTKRYCTDMMEACAPQVIGKTGAEGVFCMSFPEQGIGVCIKIDDGKMLPQYNVAQALLEASGLFGKEQLGSLHHYMQSPITNFNGLETGEIRVREGLFRDLRISEYR